MAGRRGEGGSWRAQETFRFVKKYVAKETLEARGGEERED